MKKICSIDELACRLTGREQKIDAAKELAAKIKRTIQAQVGEHMKCSIGLGPSLFLGKVGSDMQKPNGLVTITQKDLPHILHRLKLTDIYGIGRRMEQRLNQLGISTTEDLMRASRQQLRQAWGGVTGVLYYELLHGADLQFPSSSESKSMSHQHVLEPALRNNEGARQFSDHLLAKAGERLRHQGYFCRRLGLHLSSADERPGFWDEIDFHETQDSDFLLQRLIDLWKNVPRMKPIKVGVVLMGLVPAARHQPDLFADNTRKQKLSPLVDAINRRHGRGAISFGKISDRVNHFAGHAAFQRVPEPWEF